MARPRTRPPGTNISEEGVNLCELKCRSWVRRAREASCCDCVSDSALFMVCTMSCCGLSGVREWLPSSPSTSAFPSKCERNMSSSLSMGGEASTGEGDRCAKSKSIVLSADMHTRPRWLMREQLKVRTECSPSEVLRTDLTSNFLVNVSPANAGQWYTAFLNPTCTLAASAWLILPVRKSMREKGRTWSCRPSLRANGVEVEMRSWQ
mmetsp:Transcript_17353/g.35253  ORF Transcript_17353/g.35253 Transcript_17353/m.35253 type:complete len:207 (+) Transcript_17353:451-1071(+)